jgi:hypothetical protein
MISDISPFVDLDMISSNSIPRNSLAVLSKAVVDYDVINYFRVPNVPAFFRENK